MIKAIGAMTTLVLFLLTACQASSPSRAGEETMATPAKGGGKTLGMGITGQVRCAGRCIPRVELFDAASLTLVTVTADGVYRFPAREGTRYLALSAAGHRPLLLRLEAGEAPPAVTLEPAADPRLSELFGVTVHTVVGGKGASSSTLQPVPQKKLIILRGRARQEITSDARGEFRLALPAGHYDLIVDGRRQPLELPPQGSLFLPVTVGTTMVD